MKGIQVSITRYISDEPQPGIVECELVDAYGRRWYFVEKTAVVSNEHLNSSTSYPQPGMIACEVITHKCDASGRSTILIDTERPWGVESSEGVTQFEVEPASLIEWK